MMKFKKILYKISGEALMGSREYGQDPVMLRKVANDIKRVHDFGIQVCVVVGGGNIFRGIKSADSGIDRVTGDYIGMLATVMNALALQSTLETLGIETRVMSGIQISAMCEGYIKRRADRHLEKGRVIIFAAGTGNPFFTTDTGGVLRAIEMGCDAFFKGTSVDGIYSSDPKKNPDAVKYHEINYDSVIQNHLKVMDISAVSLASENHLPIYIFSLKTSESPLFDVLSEKLTFSRIIE